MRVREQLPIPVDETDEGDYVFAWPAGELRDVVPIESPAELAERGGLVTPRLLIERDDYEDEPLPDTLPDGTPRGGAG